MARTRKKRSLWGILTLIVLMIVAAVFNEKLLTWVKKIGPIKPLIEKLEEQA